MTIVRIWEAAKSKLSLTEIFIGATLIVYAAGFITTNLHLGAFGVVNFHFLKIKYFLAGMLFLVFSFLVIYPLLSLNRKLRIKGLSTLGAVRMFLSESFNTFGSYVLIGIFLRSVFGFSRYPALSLTQVGFTMSNGY